MLLTSPNRNCDDDLDEFIFFLKSFADIKHVTVTAHTPDLSDPVTELEMSLG